MLTELVGHKIVVDLRSTYVCIGTLAAWDEAFLDLRDVDFHDLRDTETSRENYVAESVATGIKRNRKKIIVFRAEVIAVSKLTDVVDV